MENEAESRYDDRSSLYAALGVSTDASQEEIRRAYRQLAAVYHPDKTADPELRIEASQVFTRIQEAYEILSDPMKRDIYDVYGMEGLTAGMELSTSVHQSRDELKKEWESYRSKKAKELMEGKVNYRGQYIFRVDATATVRPYNKKVSRTPDLKNIYMTSGVDVPIDPRHWWTPISAQQDIAHLGGFVTVRRGHEGGGAVLAGYRRTYADYSSLDLSLAAGLKTVVSLTSTMPLSQRASASVSGSWQPPQGEEEDWRDGIGLQFMNTRQLSEKWSGEHSWVVGPRQAGGMSLGLTRRSEKLALTFKVEIGASTALSIRCAKQINEKKSLRVAGRVTPGGPELELGGSHKMSDVSSGGLSIGVGPQGVVLKCRYIRGGHLFEFPILLSTSLDAQIVTAAFSLPPLILWSLSNLVIKPLGRSIQQRMSRQNQELRREEITAAVAQAAAAAALMASVARRRTLAESRKDGLIVVLALYGSESRVVEEAEKRLLQLSDMSEEEEEQEEGETMPAVIDVTIAVQYLVMDSKVLFHKGYSKSGLLGFCDPCPGEDKLLVVYYRYQSRPMQAIVMDGEGAILPLKGKEIASPSRVSARIMELSEGMA